MTNQSSPAARVREIRRKTRRRYTAEKKVCIVLQAGKRRLQGDTQREAICIVLQK